MTPLDGACCGLLALYPLPLVSDASRDIGYRAVGGAARSGSGGGLAFDPLAVIIGNARAFDGNDESSRALWKSAIQILYQSEQGADSHTHSCSFKISIARAEVVSILWAKASRPAVRGR